ncbi:hypothetical protein AB205_0151660 [Aquarana catesbeiana]|uniref:Uncharacterized protein n=1 Tax=Aquarana catesbeiana TaxID=8400 RepID=A0A2G9QCM4_AQUCT|nr:hypothetical protein AB205_0151660 [Aquarana catesbeiana]
MLDFPLHRILTMDGLTADQRFPLTNSGPNSFIKMKIVLKNSADRGPRPRQRLRWDQLPEARAGLHQENESRKTPQEAPEHVRCPPESGPLHPAEQGDPTTEQGDPTTEQGDPAAEQGGPAAQGDPSEQGAPEGQ